MTDFCIKDKRIIITGGSRGLGYGMAKALYEAGAKLIIIARDEKRLQECKAELEDPARPLYYVAADLGDKESLTKAFWSSLELLGGKIDVLVNCAGIQYRCPAVDFPAEKWESILNLNLSSAFYMAQLAGKEMIRQGYGKIINIASMTSFFGSQLIPAYAASKGGIMQLTKALSNEWAQYGVSVNAIAPGYMETELTADLKEKNPAQYTEVCGRIPAKRWGKPEDLAGIVIFLSSAASDYISGAIIPVDGGYLGK